MFATPAVLALLIFVYIRPQEIYPVLTRVPLLYLLVLLALLGLGLDVRLRWSRLRQNPLLPWAAAHLGWSIVSMLAMARWALLTQGVMLAVALIIFVALSQGVQSFRAIGNTGVGLLGLSLFITAVGVHQAYAPKECARPSELVEEALIPLGDGCETREQCWQRHDREDVMCEHVGLLGTTSIGGRVRYRGLMQDPNELALVTSMTIPFVFALVELRRTLTRLLLALGTLAASAICVVNTRSRSGQMAFAAVLGVYLLRRLRWAGVALAAVMALPILMLGGRATEEADASSNLRLGYWSAAIQMARESPFVGVGMAQFTEHEAQTAHSSFMLALGERGVPGLFFWSALIYMAFKTTLSVLRVARAPEAYAARVWATALLASLAGFVISAFFLSLTDHYVLWVYLGLAGALYGATVKHAPDFRVRFGLRDLVAVGAFDAVLVVALHFYTRSKGF